MARKKELDKLTRENMQALAAGMSYGKWKALQPIVPIEPKEPKEIYKEFTCAYCGCKFVRTDNKLQKYCGDRCKQAADRKRQYEKRKAGGAK